MYCFISILLIVSGMNHSPSTAIADTTVPNNLYTVLSIRYPTATAKKDQVRIGFHQMSPLFILSKKQPDYAKHISYLEISLKKQVPVHVIFSPANLRLIEKVAPATDTEIKHWKQIH
jgi:hypothetical protein